MCLEDLRSNETMFPLTCPALLTPRAHRFFKQGISELDYIEHVMMCSTNYHVFKIPHLAWHSQVLFKSMLSNKTQQKVKAEFHISENSSFYFTSESFTIFQFFLAIFSNDLPHEQLRGKTSILKTWGLFHTATHFSPIYTPWWKDRWRSPLPKCGWLWIRGHDKPRRLWEWRSPSVLSRWYIPSLKLT